jgi:hypothetical protein
MHAERAWKGGFFYELNDLKHTPLSSHDCGCTQGAPGGGHFDQSDDFLNGDRSGNISHELEGMVPPHPTHNYQAGVNDSGVPTHVNQWFIKGLKGSSKGSLKGQL